MAFGPIMETTMSALLFVFLMFVLVGYQVLLRDIWTPLVQQALAGMNSIIISSEHDQQHETVSSSSSSSSSAVVPGNLVLLIVMVLLIPFVIQHSLYALRYNCFVGFASVSVLCFALCHHGFFGSIPTDYGNIQLSDDENDHHNNNNLQAPQQHIRYGTTNIGDVLFAFPIIMLSFLSHFNILPIQAALVRPTRTRTRIVVRAAVTGCFGLMYLFGLGGYFYAGIHTQGNILLNIATRHDDFMFVLGRLGVGISSKSFGLFFFEFVRVVQRARP